MLNAVVIEDERPAVENLITALSSVARDVNITACLYSVRESIEYLSRKPAVDLIFSNVELHDGLSFEIFHQVSFGTPVIFITGKVSKIGRIIYFNTNKMKGLLIMSSPLVFTENDTWLLRETTTKTTCQNSA